MKKTRLFLSHSRDPGFNSKWTDWVRGKFAAPAKMEKDTSLLLLFCI